MMRVLFDKKYRKEQNGAVLGIDLFDSVYYHIIEDIFLHQRSFFL